MYALDKIESCKISEAADTYVYDIIPIAIGLAAISSDDCLRLLDIEALSRPAVNVISDIKDITCLEAISNTSKHDATTVCTGGRDGRLYLIDLRTGLKAAEIKTEQDAPVLSIAGSSAFGLAAGTEFINHQAAIFIWDIRQLRQPVLQYIESHSDDITELKFHPTRPQILLSGSTDGLVNVFNGSITDEEEALHQTINHGASIHHANFLSDTEIFALSHDEKFSTYELVTDPAPGVAELPPIHHGNMREVLNGDYVANVVRRPDGTAAIGVGAHSRQNFELIQLKKNPGWQFAPESRVTLSGAHGSEIVRAFCFMDSHKTVLTAGEDGEIKAWKGV